MFLTWFVLDNLQKAPQRHKTVLGRWRGRGEEGWVIHRSSCLCVSCCSNRVVGES